MHSTRIARRAGISNCLCWQTTYLAIVTIKSVCREMEEAVNFLTSRPNKPTRRKRVKSGRCALCGPCTTKCPKGKRTLAPLHLFLICSWCRLFAGGGQKKWLSCVPANQSPVPVLGSHVCGKTPTFQSLSSFFSFFPFSPITSNKSSRIARRELYNQDGKS